MIFMPLELSDKIFYLLWMDAHSFHVQKYMNMVLKPQKTNLVAFHLLSLDI